LALGRYFGSHDIILFHRKDAESAKKRYFSFAVERTAKEKNQSLRDILGLQMPVGRDAYCFPSSQRKTIK
jgi:hypothetical protein